MSTAFTQSTISTTSQAASKIENLDTARAVFQKLKSTPGSDKYIYNSLEALYTSPPFCALRALDSILRADTSIRPQSFIGKTNFKHKPTQDIIERLQQLSVFISEKYGLQIANKVSYFPIVETLTDTLKADTARLEHILRASDDTLSHYMSDNIDIKTLLHKRKVLYTATSIARSLLALKSTTFLIDQLLHKGDLINAIAIFHLADVAIRTSKTVLVDTESMREGLKKVHDRLAYQLKHHILTVFYGRGAVTGLTSNLLTSSEGEAGSASFDVPYSNSQDSEVFDSFPCISSSYSLALYRAIQNLSFLPLCVFLRSVVARAYKTDELIQSFIESLGILKDTAFKNNPFFSVTPAQDAVIKNSTIESMPPELYSILLGQSILMLYESELAADSFYNVSNSLRAILLDNMESQLISIYTQAEYDYAARADEAPILGSALVSNKLAPASMALNLHRADHVAKLRRLIFDITERAHIANFQTTDTAPLKEFAEISRRYLRLVYFSMLNITLFYGSFLVCYKCYLQATQKKSLFEKQKPSVLAPSLVKTMMSTKSRAMLPSLPGMGTGLMTSMQSHPSTIPNSPPSDSEHICFKKAVEIIYSILGETSSSPDSSSISDFCDADLDSSQHSLLIDGSSLIPSVSLSLNSKRIPSSTYSSATPIGKLAIIKKNEQIPFMSTIFALDSNYPFMGSTIGLNQLLGKIYESAVRHLAHYCSVNIQALGYTRLTTHTAQQSHGDKQSGVPLLSQESSIYDGIGSSMQQPFTFDTQQSSSIGAASSSMFSLSWVKSLLPLSSSTGSTRVGGIVKSDYWNALYLENYMLSFYYCSVLLTGGVRIDPIDEIFSRFFSKLLDTYTSYMSDSTNNLFSLVQVSSILHGSYAANIRTCGLDALFLADNTQHHEDEASCYSTCGAPSDSVDVLTSTAGLLRVDSSYSLAHAIMGDNAEVRNEVTEFNVYNFVHYTLQFLADIMTFSSTSCRYYEENAPSILISVCNTFLTAIYARMHMHYKSLYSYALLFTPAGNNNTQGFTISSYEALLDDYLSSKNLSDDRIECFDLMLGQHDVELYVGRSSFSGLNTLTVPCPSTDQQSNYMDELLSLNNEARDSLASTAASKRSSVTQPLAFRQLSLTARRSKNIESQEGTSTISRGHSRQVSGLEQLFDGGFDRTDQPLSNTQVTGGSPVRRIADQDVDLPVRLPNVVLEDGDMFEHALYCLQGCILVYNYLKRLIPMLSASENTCYSRFKVTIKKILHFLALEWRLYVTVHIKRGFTEDLKAPPEHVQIGTNYSISGGYKNLIDATKKLRVLTERPDFDWMMNYDTVIFGHIYYTIKRLLTRELSSISSSTLTNNQAIRMMTAIQSLCIVINSSMDLRSIIQDIHDLCSE